EEQADLTMDRISLAIMSSSAAELGTTPEAPLSDSKIEYTKSLGIQDGQPVYGDPERIEYLNTEGQVVWTQMPAGEDPRSVVWSSWVAKQLKGEMSNGVDDNKNGLIDEKGLAFDRKGSKVNIKLTLERKDPSGSPYSKMVKATVACRN